MIEIKDTGDFDFFDKIDEIASKEVEVGYTQSSGHHDEMGLADLAILMEFGGVSPISEEYRARAATKGVHFGSQESINIPARPAMRGSFDNNTQQIGDKGVKLFKSFLENKIDSETAYEIWGDEYRDIFRNSITSKELGLKPNSPRTIQIKESDTPWVDSARLINGADVMVGKK